MAGANVLRVPLGNDQAFLDRIERTIEGLYPGAQAAGFELSAQSHAMTIDPASGSGPSPCAAGAAS
jgi:alanine-synthesizing transaminase